MRALPLRLPPSPDREVVSLDVGFLTVRPEDLVPLSMELASKVRDSGFRPDAMVAIHRGGMIVARFLSDYLDVRDIRAIRVEHYSGVGRRGGVRIAEPLPTSLGGKSVLLVDDVADTGDSLEVAREHIISRGAREVRIATMHYKPWSRVVPDYYVVETTDWVVYCWEYAETARSLMEILTAEGKSREEAIGIITNDAGVPEEVLRWVGIL